MHPTGIPIGYDKDKPRISLKTLDKPGVFFFQ